MTMVAVKTGMHRLRRDDYGCSKDWHAELGCMGKKAAHNLLLKSKGPRCKMRG